MVASATRITRHGGLIIELGRRPSYPDQAIHITAIITVTQAVEMLFEQACTSRTPLRTQGPLPQPIGASPSLARCSRTLLARDAELSRAALELGLWALAPRKQRAWSNSRTDSCAARINCSISPSDCSRYGSR